jgi:hypothetical protein
MSSAQTRLLMVRKFTLNDVRHSSMSAGECLLGQHSAISADGTEVASIPQENFPRQTLQALASIVSHSPSAQQMEKGRLGVESYLSLILSAQ